MSESTPSQPVPSFGEACDRGRVREENQDCVRHVSTAMGELLLVADGIGGYRGGGTASGIVVESFASWVSALAPNYSAARAIAEAAAQANANIMETAASGEPAYQQMGSTVVLALITQDQHSTRAWIGHIGDSRAYLARDGVLSRLTRDHSAVQALIDRNELSPENARSHPDASVLTRSLGHQPEVEIEITMTPLEAGDSLLLCSDGLWGFVPEQDIADVLTNLEIAAGTAADQLLDLALQAGGPDNIGIEVVRYRTAIAEPEPMAEPGEDENEQPPSRRRTVALALLMLAIVLGALVGWYADHNWVSPIAPSR